MYISILGTGHKNHYKHIK